MRFHDPSDVDFMMELSSDPEVTRFTGDGPIARREDALARIANLQRQAATGFGRMVVLDRESGERLGWCGLKNLADEKQVDLGYRFFRRHWGKGYATESSRVALAHGFTELALSRIVATVSDGNVASERVMKKLGFVSTGRAVIDGDEGPAFLLTREAWQATLGV